jgi:hypothetical protein
MSSHDLTNGGLPPLDPDEELAVEAAARDARLLVTNKRLLVAADRGVTLNVPIEGLRRIQLDLERERPATLVVVPEMRHDEPQVLSLEPEQYDAAARLLVAIGRRFAEIDRQGA